MKRFPWIMSLGVGVLFAGTALAADAEGFFDKAAVETFLVDHKITFARHADNNRVKWDIRKNGTLYGENLTLNSKDTARWTIDDKGALCLKWKGNSADACRVFATRDAKTQMFDPANTAVVVGTIEQVD